MSMLRIEPLWVGEARRALERQVRETGSPQVRGLRQSRLIESLDDPGRVIWLSAWDSLDDCQTFMGSPAYLGWVSSVQSYLQGDPLWFRYRVLADLVADDSGETDTLERR